MLWFVVAGRRIYCFQHLLRYGRIAPVPIQEQTRLLAQRLGLAHCPTVLLVPGRVSPLLWALGRKACLVIPADLLERLGPEQRSSLLAHELAHARRRDHWVRWLEFAVSGLYWWLPVMWWARSQLQQAEEECCDAWVVWTLPAAAKAYAKALLQTVDFLDARPALPPVASGVGHVHFLKRRLTMIVRQPLCPSLPWPVQLGVIVLGLLVLPLAPQRLAAQNSDDKSEPEGATDTAVVRAEQDPADRDVERRLRTLEEKMDRLLQKLDGQRGERSEGRPSREEKGSQEDKAKAKERAEMAKEKAREAAAEQRARARAMAEKAREKARAERDKDAKVRAEQMKELGRTLDENKGLNTEQIQRLIEEIQAKVSKEFDPKRMKELQKRIEESVDKNINPERMEEIQRRINDAMKKSTQQLNEALKKSTEQLDRAKKSLLQADQQRANAPRIEKGREQEGRDLERRMDRLEQKMDRVLQALEKQGKSGKGV
jgi:hypothetical protein